jgi:creatinine amidohydrolase/Fe(II)-dependent formamide hydrolase-like protein
MGTWPENVDLSRCKENTEWFTKSAVEASAETGRHMVDCTLEWLRKAIVYPTYTRRTL